MKKKVIAFIAATTIALPMVASSAAENLALLAKPVARGPLAAESIYFIMTDRFANGDTTNDQAGLTGSRTQTGFDPSDKAYFHGGDIKGLTAHLEYIKSLGFTSIWITPPVKNQYVQGSSAAYHGYWGVDFSTIDPHLGTEADFKNFVSAAHALGIKVIVDIVVNHTGDVIKYTVGKYGYRNQAEYPYKTCAGKAFDVNLVAGKSTFPKLCATKSFAYIPTVDKWNTNIKKPAFLNDLTNYHNRGDSTWVGTSIYDGDFFGLDDLFTEKPAVVAGWTANWSSWITRFNIDGYRVDTAKHVNPEFWQAFLPKIYATAKAAGKKEFPVFGEVADSDPRTLSIFVKEQYFNTVLDFGFQSTVARFVSTGSGLDGMVNLFNADDMYTSSTTSAYSLATFLGNHDMGRIGHFISNNSSDNQETLARSELGNALLMTLRGGPILYYGDEVGMTGIGGDQDSRQDMFPTLVSAWQSEVRLGGSPIGTASAFDVKNPLKDQLAALNALRKSEPALSQGGQQIRYAREGLFAFSRFLNGQEILVLANGANDLVQAEIPVSTAGAQWKTLLGKADVTSSSNSVSVTVPALGYVILKADRSYQPQSAIKVTLEEPENGYVTNGWTLLTANVPGDDFVEVTFAARNPGKSWVTIGTADRRTYDPARNYRVYMYDKLFKSGSTVEIIAIAKNSKGETAISKSQSWKIS